MVILRISKKLPLHMPGQLGKTLVNLSGSHDPPLGTVRRTFHPRLGPKHGVSRLAGSRGLAVVALTMDSDHDPQVIVCQGPPRCMLQDDEAVKAQQSGCIWCRRITVHKDGTETETGPVEVN